MENNTVSNSPDSPTSDPENTLDSLLAALHERGLLNKPQVEAAFRAVPRHLFLPGLTPNDVYIDDAIPIKYDDEGHVVSSSSQPSMMLLMLEQLDLKPGLNVLEIGTGTGYNAAIIQYLVGQKGKVTSVEFDPIIARQANDNLLRARYSSVLVVTDDGAAGYAPRAAYDRIICTAGIWDVPSVWIRQLKTDGLIVTPIALDGAQVSATFQRIGHETLESSDNIPCGFVLMQGAGASPAQYRKVGSTALTLAGERISQMDTTALHLLLSSDQDQCHLGQSLAPGDIWRGFSTYMMLNHPPEYTFAMYSIAKDQQAYGMEGSGVALFSPGSACLIPYNGQGLTYCFAGSDSFIMTEKLMSEWLELGRPDVNQLRLRLSPKSEGLPQIQRGRLYERRDHYLHVWLETPPVTDSPTS
jgi:protein-L-isoaspartate(D-aspartate) O-methyltransferase